MTDHEVSEMSLQMVGELNLDDPAEVVLSIATADSDLSQEVQVDGQTLVFDPLEDGTEVSLSVGVHSIRWTIGAERLLPAFLRIQNAATGRRLPVVQPVSAAGDNKPTTLTVAVLRNAK